MTVNVSRSSSGVVVGYQFQQSVDGLFFRNVFRYTLLLAIEGDLSAPGAHVAVVGIGHLTRAVDDAAHDANLQTDKVAGGGFDAGYRVL